jgi:hypothetical protein
MGFFLVKDHGAAHRPALHAPQAPNGGAAAHLPVAAAGRAKGALPERRGNGTPGHGEGGFKRF